MSWAPKRPLWPAEHEPYRSWVSWPCRQALPFLGLLLSASALPWKEEELVSSAGVEGIHVCVLTGFPDTQPALWLDVVSCQALLNTSHFLQKLAYSLIMIITGHLQGAETKAFHKQNTRPFECSGSQCKMACDCPFFTCVLQPTPDHLQDLVRTFVNI